MYQTRQKVLGLWQKCAASTTIPPTSTSDVVQHYKTGSIIFRAYQLQASRVKTHSHWYTLHGKIVFCSWKTCTIQQSLMGFLYLLCLEINWRHSFWNSPCICNLKLLFFARNDNVFFLLQVCENYNNMTLYTGLALCMFVCMYVRVYDCGLSIGMRMRVYACVYVGSRHICIRIINSALLV